MIGVGVGIMDCAYRAAQLASGSSFDPNLEWSPDPGFDDASKWTFLTRCDVNLSNASEVTTTTTSAATLKGPNAPGVIPPDGTYRFTVAAADHISTTLPATGIGIQFGVGVAVPSSISQALLASGGFVDVAITGCTTTDFGFGLGNKMYAVPSISCKRIS